ILETTSDGGAIYFMQREKNTEHVLRCLRETGWTFQNLIIWKKKTSAVPGTFRFGKHHQVIAFATKGSKPRLFNRLRIDPPLLATEKNPRPTGMYVTDVWDDIRELTSGYYAGDEPLRDTQGERQHKQQSPIALLLRIILSSTRTGDTVLDPFAGTGTTLVVAEQLSRCSIGIENAPENAALITERLEQLRAADSIDKYYDDYRHTENLSEIWGQAHRGSGKNDVFNLPLFRSFTEET
ncbi:MAG TPA: site-specific DNA-methyltransferase, partial [Aggregatilineales bacterium]|nr:site-specific DNA-methyltransferase [Aggregatilineales bacterium]